jgi:LysM repeat protein
LAETAITINFQSGLNRIKVIHLIYYTIKPGDTIYNLASQYNIPAASIITANPGIYPYNLMIGQQIRIPTASNNNPPGTRRVRISSISPGELKLRNALRKLWEQHVAWTRMTILSAAADAPDLSVTANRLLRNAADMAAALKPYYGETNAANFGRLIHDHLTIAMQLVTAAKQGNAPAAQEAQRQWYANADQIADYVHTLNPYIDRDAFRKMLYTHLALTKEEAVNRLNHNYEKDTALYDQIEDEVLDMADMMSAGIVRQYPNLFRA